MRSKTAIAFLALSLAAGARAGDGGPHGGGDGSRGGGHGSRGGNDGTDPTATGTIPGTSMPPGTGPAPGSPTGFSAGQMMGSPTGSTPGQNLASPTGSVPGQDNNAPQLLETPLNGRTGGSGLSDRATEARVRRNIFSQPALGHAGRRVQVSSFNGRVTLQGEVHTEHQKRRIGASAEHVAGHGNVSNELIVRP